MSLQSKIDQIVKLYTKGSYKEVIGEINKLEDKKINSPQLKNFKGLAYLAQEEFNKASDFFNQATTQDKKFFKAYNNYGISLFNDGKFEKALERFNKAIKIKPNYAEAYNNKGILLNHIGNNTEAIECFITAIKINPDFSNAIENLIGSLTNNTKIKNTNNELIKIHNKINKLNFKFDNEKKINNNNLKKIFSECDKIISDNYKTLKVNFSQIIRKNTKNLNCERHFKIFNKFKIIPEYCFGCFKVGIELKNVLDLIKLYIIFDNIKLPNDNMRKCMIETRKKLSGNYKGFIYCDSLKEAQELETLIKSVIFKTISNDVNILIKRGCSEYSFEHPNYKELNEKSINYMKYNIEWKEKENLVDNNYGYLNKKTILKSLKGISLNDILIIKNWLYFAKLINDESYKEITDSEFKSNYIENLLNNQLEYRKSQLK